MVLILTPVRMECLLLQGGTDQLRKPDSTEPQLNPVRKRSVGVLAVNNHWKMSQLFFSYSV